MVVYGAKKGDWGIWGETIYANLGNSNADVAGIIKIEPKINVLWQSLGGSYRIGTWGLTGNSGAKAPSVTIETYFGARYTYLDLRLDIKSNPFGLGNVEGDKHWVDPLVGLKTTWDFTERWAISLAGDIGGFGVGSDFAWNAFGLIGYRFGLFGTNNAAVYAGYRALSQDYTDGSGDDKFKWDVILHGPIAGLRIAF